MEEVIANRQRWGQLPAELPAVDGYIAVADCGQIGDILFVRRPGYEWEKFMVADCAGSPETIQWMHDHNILMEVDYQTALRWNIVGRGGVRVDIGKLVRQRINRR